MANHTNLSTLFTDIADAIRGKTGSSDMIIADDFPSEIDKIIASPVAKGITWTQSNITSGTAECIVYGEGIWVMALRDDTGIYYSTDGMTWTQSNITTGSIDSIVNANGIWVTSGSNGLYYSTDGKTWTQSNITSNTARSITSNDGIWVADITFPYGQASIIQYLYYSTDGKTWTKTNLGHDVYCYSNVCYGNGVWRCWMDDGYLYYSTDGMTWNRGEALEENGKCLYYANGVWVRHSDYGSVGIAYSTDGISWTQSNITTGVIYDIACADGKWVANGAYVILYSTDGMNWTQIDVTVNLFWSNIYNVMGIWYIDSLYSLDGVNWINGEYSTTDYLTCCHGYLLNRYEYSTDGVTWNSHGLNIACVVSINGRVIASSYKDGLYYFDPWQPKLTE